MKNFFNELDGALKNLGQSDSSIKHSNYIRAHFDDVLYFVTCLKIESGNFDLIKEDNWYLGKNRIT